MFQRNLGLVRGLAMKILNFANQFGYIPNFKIQKDTLKKSYKNPIYFEDKNLSRRMKRFSDENHSRRLKSMRSKNKLILLYHLRS